jgi:hypothetical protein
MTIDTTGAPPPPAEAVASKNSFERIAGVLFTPTETFADIARKPNFLVPLLLIIAIGYVCTFLMIPRMDWDSAMAQQMETMKKRQPNMSEGDLAQAQKVGKAVASVIMYISPLLGVLWYLIVALVLFGAFRLMGGQGTFAQAFSATLYAWIPLVLFSIILTIVIVVQGTVDPTTMATAVKSNPAFLVDMKEQPVLFSLLSAIDLFTIWTIALLITGFAALSRKTWAQSAVIVISLWVVFILVKIGFAALGAMQQSA